MLFINIIIIVTEFNPVNLEPKFSLRLIFQPFCNIYQWKPTFRMIHQHFRTFGDKENDFLVPARTVWKGQGSCPHPHNPPCISLWNNYLQNCSLARFKHLSSAPLLSHTPTQSQFTTGCLCVIYHSHVVYLCAEAELMFFLFWTKKNPRNVN